MKKLKRREFITKSSMAAAAGTSLLTTACSSKSSNSPSGNAANLNFNKNFQLKMVTTWPPNFPVLGEACHMFADRVKKMSGGRLTVDVYGGGELVPALEVFSAVSNGVADLGHGTPYYWAGKIPAAQIFSAVPFGMNAQQLNAWMLSGGGMELWEETYKPFNIIPFLGGNTGVQMGGWFNKTINSIEDVQGLKMRIPSLGGQVISMAGGSAVLSAAGEIYTNLERGVIDATEWIGPYHDYKMGFHEVASYYYYPGWQEPCGALELTANKGTYENLPSDLQEIIKWGAKSLNGWVLSEFEAQNNKYLKKILNESNTELKQFPKEVLDKFRQYSKDVIADFTSQDQQAQKIYDSYKKFQQEITDWAKITEQIYYNELM